MSLAHIIQSQWRARSISCESLTLVLLKSWGNTKGYVGRDAKGFMQEAISSAPNENLNGAVERVTFHSDESGYSVLRVKAKGHKDLVTLVGHVASVQPGEYIEAWEAGHNIGISVFSLGPKTVRTVHPSTIEGIERYLGSGMIKGIGPHLAKK